MNKIREAAINDLNGLSKLFDDYRIFYEKESDRPGASKFLEERMLKKESVIFVSENSEHVLTGFVQLYPIFSSTRMKKLWLLNDLFVVPEFRGQQISIRLIDAAKEHAVKTKACGLMLETAKSNGIGNSLYPRTGFVLDTEFNYYYWDNNR